MKYQIKIDGGLWANCQCIPESWQPLNGHDTRYYVGEVNSIAEAWALVMQACMEWLVRVIVIKLPEENIWTIKNSSNKIYAIITQIN